MTFTNVEELHSALLTVEPSDFVSRYLFEPVPHVFEDDLDLWIAWKKRLASHLEVDPYEMVLTGSAAVGYSLSPWKNFAEYHTGSDIDVGVVSAHHFEVAWRYLRHARPSWLSLPWATRNAIESHRKNHVFCGTIATDHMLALLPFGQAWQTGLDEMADYAPTIGREVKLRIYRDYEALRAYQAHGAELLRAALLDTNDSEVPITEVED